MNTKTLPVNECVQNVQSQILSTQNLFFTGSLQLEEIGEYIPGSVMVQDLQVMTNTYMNNKGCEILNKSKEELAAMGPNYFRDFFPAEEVSWF